uniref:Sulfotransferase domain-containing protein n=1 Tax=Candidatus Kentrum eta TaxID=2126337 RepID=A0A450UQJ7_9GAMM|nr:MAG: Sulfotransferase domain-containing protein [Candidatus Kentron sp. H]VFJ94843.1 MAG: Sulfotransferase domain-containing protein [Candidatus Kentron sp. H]VFK01305.1 MAG: Sulfotransferase domain-containing protein [Candidatus Kentron sp. H]
MANLIKAFGRRIIAGEQKHLDITFPRLPYGARPRVLLATQPKAGTYLLSEILSKIGFDQTYLHLGLARLEAYDPVLLEMGAANPKAFSCAIPINESLRLIRSGQFAASHLVPTGTLDALIGDSFKVLVCVRELRSSLTSLSNFFASLPRGGDLGSEVAERGITHFLKKKGAKTIKQAELIWQWKEREYARIIRFEDIVNGNESVIEDIGCHIGLNVKNAASIVHSALEAQTLTKSIGFTKLEWGEQEERQFIRLGGDRVNKLMGYNG